MLLQPFVNSNKEKKEEKQEFFLTLGVSICLDVVSICLDVVSICLDVVSIETLDLDTKKKLVSTIEKFRFCLDTTIQIQISRSRSRFIETYRDFPKISIVSRSWSRSSYNFHKSWSRLLLLIHFTNRHLWKDVTFHSCLLVKISKKCWEILINLKMSQ